MVLILKESGTLIGDIGLHFPEADSLPDTVEIGYTLAAAYHGNGYATEALTAIIEYLRTALGKKNFTASVDPENTASIRVLERLGFCAAIRANEQEITFRKSS